MRGMVEGVLDGPLGDLVEGDAVRFVLVEVEGFLQVPGDGFALAVRVGREIDGLGPGGLLLEAGQKLLAVGQRLIGRPPALLDVDAELLVRQIAHVALARGDLIVRAEIFIDRLGLGRRFDDDQVLLLPCCHCGPS